MTQTTASLERAVDEFRRVLSSATATAQAIDRGESWDSVALNAIDDGYVDFAAQLSAFFDAQDQACDPGVEASADPAGGVRKREEPPTGICPECGFVAFGLDYCGQCPSESPEGVQCKGWMRSAVHAGDWRACVPCSGAGSDGSARECAHCNGIGWLFVRPGGLRGTSPSTLPVIGRRR